jgi:DMSO reductase family type II enzyme heme b subunit
VLLAVLATHQALANEAFFKAEVVDAVTAPKVPSSPGDAAWAKAPARTFALSPQRTVHLHDRKANEVLARPVKSEVLVKAVVGPDGLAVRLEWADPAREVVRTDESNVFADSVALETPEQFGAGLRLPAISMGDEGAVVDVTLLRATASGALENHFTAAGFGSSTRQAPGSPTTAMQYDEATKRWAAVFLLPRAHVKGLTPVAFATWDGGRLERAGYKRLSSWHFVRVPGEPLDTMYVKEMAFGYEPGDLGDVARGRALGESVCIACHRLPNKAIAPAGLAPALEDIGAIATAGYLRDSIVTPSAVILHEPNPNQHYSPSAPRDLNGAAPNADAYQWSSLGPDGKRVSKMPVFSNFTPGQVADLVAFLKTLDGQPKENAP